MAILASSSYSITDVVDGKTTYPHYAYSDNADGTGLTFTDNGQRYQGYYSDYTQADSTDKTKYKWADRWAKIEVGGENLVDKTGEPFVMGYGITNTTWNAETKRTRLTFGTGVERAKQVEILPQGWIFESQNVIIQKNQTYTQAIRVATDATFLGRGDLVFTWFGPEVISGTYEHRHYLASIRKIGVNEYLIWSTVTWDRPDIKLRPFDIYNLHTALDFRNSGTFLEFYQPKLETGTIPTAHTLSESDRQNQLDSKADQALTQKQINALNEKNNLIQANMEALAAAKALTDLEKAYKEYVKANDAAKKVSEGELASLKKRTAEHVTKLAGFAEDWEFMTTKLRVAEEGIYFGKLDGSSEVKITDDRISFWSSKKEVMWITAGTLNIDNGIFTVSVQIGRFREEQYTTNPDINVIRYVG